MLQLIFTEIPSTKESIKKLRSKENFNQDPADSSQDEQDSSTSTSTAGTSYASDPIIQYPTTIKTVRTVYTYDHDLGYYGHVPTQQQVQAKAASYVQLRGVTKANKQSIHRNNLIEKEHKRLVLRLCKQLQISPHTILFCGNVVQNKIIKKKKHRNERTIVVEHDVVLTLLLKNDNSNYTLSKTFKSSTICQIKRNKTHCECSVYWWYNSL